jgi:hypothetical protein
MYLQYTTPVKRYVGTIEILLNHMNQRVVASKEELHCTFHNEQGEVSCVQ